MIALKCTTIQILDIFSGILVLTVIPFAGTSCEHHATDTCVTNVSVQNPPGGYFCTNQGKCKEYVTDVEPEEFPRCTCPKGWVGPRCEGRFDSMVEKIPRKTRIYIYTYIYIGWYGRRHRIGRRRRRRIFSWCW